jgi:hypothetical protein
MSRFALLLTLLCSSAWSQADNPDDVSDLDRNPSFINADLAQPNLSVTICKSAETQLMLKRGVPGPLSDYRDNLVLLCAGKNPLERSSFCRMVCLGDITLEGMQAIFLAPASRVEYDRVFSR